MTLGEHALAEAWQEHHKRQNRVARAKLILHYEPYARRLAVAQHRRVPRQVELDDLVSIAVTQMIRRIDMFNPDINESFELYAATAIRGAMLDELRSMDRVSRSTRTDHRALSSATEALERSLSRPPTLEEVATKLDRPVTTIRSTIAKVEASRTAYLDEGSVPTPPAPAPDSTIPVLQAEVVELIKSMPLTTQRILVYRYFEQRPLAQAARLIGIGEVECSRLHQAAVLAIRELAESHLTSPETPDTPNA